jgi:hypothetical protein
LLPYKDVIPNSKVIINGPFDKKAFRYLYGNEWDDIDCTIVSSDIDLPNISWQTNKDILLLWYDYAEQKFYNESTINFHEPMYLDFWYNQDGLYVTKQDSIILIRKSNREFSHMSIIGYEEMGFPENTLTVTVNDTSTASVTIKPKEQYSLEIDFPTVSVGEMLKIEFHTDTVIVPYDVGVGEDRREFGAFINQYTLS